MKHIAIWAETVVSSIGGPGLFLVSFLDSSFLSLPEINDILVVWMTTRYKERMVYYAAMATLGSVAGCFLLYVVGRRGGEALLRRRFHERRVDRALGWFARYGLLAVMVPAILPPPAPFKIFVLMAGVARVPLKQFTVAVGVGRGVRYFIEGVLAVKYGDRAIELLHEHGRSVAAGLGLIVLLAGVAYVFWRRKQARSVSR